MSKQGSKTAKNVAEMLKTTSVRNVAEQMIDEADKKGEMLMLCMMALNALGKSKLMSKKAAYALLLALALPEVSPNDRRVDKLARECLKVGLEDLIDRAAGG